MATIVLSAVGASLGGSIGGSVLGLSSAALGRFAGAALGKSIDASIESGRRRRAEQSVMGQGAEVIEAGRVERLRLTGAGEGDPATMVYGRMRVAGQVIWATQFLETVTVVPGEGGGSSGGGGGWGGKGAPAPQPSGPATHRYSYSISLAIALCEGEISGIGRIWADGVEVAEDVLNMRVYRGDRTQLPDPRIEAVEGAGMAPAYRGTAYVVFEDLALEAYGNRVPQFTFEVFRPAQPSEPDAGLSPAHAVQAVALLPGSGEYALATAPVGLDLGAGETRMINANTPSGKTDFVTGIDRLEAGLPNCGSVSLIVSWFGGDLRCGSCLTQPKVEGHEADGRGMPWSVSGLDRAGAEEVAKDGEDRPIYGGTPTDASVIQAIRDLNGRGIRVMFYPFLLMDQMAGNGLADPWSDGDDQAELPWRGRITLSQAPGREGSPDGTAAAEAEVAAFFGTAQASDFSVSGGQVSYSGPAEWRFRRFILHCAALCAAAGGVDSFCIGSEMRGLTQIRGAGNSFPAVAQLRALAAEVRAILGPGVKLGYAADWSEYFGYQPQDGSGDVYFHLDPLWADAQIDFVGIDNYMPLSDWREGEAHADAAWGSIYNPGYLAANVEGGEGYDWYYHSAEAEVAQIRTPITDGAYGEPWVYRYKDIRSWWLNDHHERIGGLRSETPTAWEPQSKPVWFTELGCAAVDKGTNQPNKFLDPKSSESALPKFSTGRRDEFIQMQYLQVLLSYWKDPARNPVSVVYGEPMLDMSRAHVWAWDARPFPAFPNRPEIWSDGPNYAAGHWITGRATGRSLASVVSEICMASGVTDFDVSGLYGYISGYVTPSVQEGRQALQPLMLRFGFDAVERGGRLWFVMRDGRADVTLGPDDLAFSDEIDGRIEETRVSEAEMTGRVRLRFVEADADFDVIAEEAVMPDEASHAVSQSEFPLALSRGTGRQVVERWLTEARLARDTVRLALPPSRMDIGAGDVLRLPVAEGEGLFRIDRVEQGPLQLLEAVRIEPETYKPVDVTEDLVSRGRYVAPVPVLPLFMDLPLMRGTEVPHAPHLAVTAKPWPGAVAVFASEEDADYRLNAEILARSTVGVTTSALAAGPVGLYDRGGAVTVRLTGGALSSVSDIGLLTGRNLAAIGDGEPGNWELFQFRDAELVAPGTWALSHRLRGQLGTEVFMPASWPEGSWFVLLDGAPQQIALALAQRGVERHYRIGPALRPLSDPTYLHEVRAFAGNGLRPYKPAHLRTAWGPGGDLTVGWIRRTRIDGDSWEGYDVPLGEESELYLVRVLSDGLVRRETTTPVSGWVYTAAERVSDGLSAGSFEVQVAQVSTLFGPGPFNAVAVDI